MGQNFTPRLKRLEANFSEMERRSTELRVAGRSRMEFYAETLAMAFCVLEGGVPGFAAALVEAAMIEDEDQAPAVESADDMLSRVAEMIRFAEQQSPGLVYRVLDAVLSGAEAITEETLFPDGRPLSEETYGSRHGERFNYRLDGTG